MFSVIPFSYYVFKCPTATNRYLCWLHTFICLLLCLNSQDLTVKMLIKEYHILLPMSLTEYQVAQLYMIQVIETEQHQVTENEESSIYSPAFPREKWQRKRTQVKIRVRTCCGFSEPFFGEVFAMIRLINNVWLFVSQNVTANHRASDAIVCEGRPQVLSGRFMYGPLDVVTLTGEK
ncbi:hypothetical protein E2320_020711, partial [Naja naja]